MEGRFGETGAFGRPVLAETVDRGCYIRPRTKNLSVGDLERLGPRKEAGQAPADFLKRKMIEQAKNGEIAA